MLAAKKNRGIGSRPFGKSGLRRKLLESWQLYLFVLPVILYLLVFNYAPMYGVQLAFKYFNSVKGIWGSKFIGMENFIRFFESYYFFRLLENTIVLNLMNLAIGFPIPILLALVINEILNEKVKKTVQTVVYAPHFISVVVVVGILNVFLNTSTGFVNILFENFGFEPISFLTKASMFRWNYVLSDIWQSAGWGSIIYLAALSSVSPELHEAAKIDGANRIKRIVHINIPAILPTAIILFILQTGRMMNVGFEKVFLLQNSMNIETAEVISTFVYTQGLVNMEYGFSTAVGLFNNLINIILLLSFNGISKRISGTSLF